MAYQNFLNLSLDHSDTNSILKGQVDAGRWQNDIKEAAVKCKAEYGITQSSCLS